MSARERLDRPRRLFLLDEVVLDTLQKDRTAGLLVAGTPGRDRFRLAVLQQLGFAEHDARRNEPRLLFQETAEERHRLRRLVLLQQAHALLIGETLGEARLARQRRRVAALVQQLGDALVEGAGGAEVPGGERRRPAVAENLETEAGEIAQDPRLDLARHLRLAALAMVGGEVIEQAHRARIGRGGAAVDLDRLFRPPEMPEDLAVAHLTR